MNELVIKAKYQIGDVLKGKQYNRPVTIIVKGITAHVTAEGQQIEYEPTVQDADYLAEEDVIGRMILETLEDRPDVSPKEGLSKVILRRADLTEEAKLQYLGKNYLVFPRYDIDSKAGTFSKDYYTALTQHKHKYIGSFTAGENIYIVLKD